MNEVSGRSSEGSNEQSHGSQSAIARAAIHVILDLCRQLLFKCITQVGGIEQ